MLRLIGHDILKLFLVNVTLCWDNVKTRKFLSMEARFKIYHSHTYKTTALYYGVLF